MKRRSMEKRVEIEKAALLSLILNLCEVAALLLFLIWLLAGFPFQNVVLLRELLCAGVILLMVEGLLSARDALLWRETGRNFEMLKDAQRNLNELNLLLRKQRHDFTNQLQVVYSLVDMGEKEEAIRYMESIYGQMRHLSTGLKTDFPSVNALLSAKLADCEKRGIQLVLKVETSLRDLPMNDWEFCRILGNLMDNAMEALADLEPNGKEEAKIELSLTEDLRLIHLSLANNGFPIAPSDWKRIFIAGFTTKKSGQGLGLAIVKELTEKAGGKIGVFSDPVKTCFTVDLPKGLPIPKEG